MWSTPNTSYIPLDAAEVKARCERTLRWVEAEYVPRIIKENAEKYRTSFWGRISRLFGEDQSDDKKLSALWVGSGGIGRVWDAPCWWHESDVKEILRMAEAAGASGTVPGVVYLSREDFELIS